MKKLRLIGAACVIACAVVFPALAETAGAIDFAPLVQQVVMPLVIAILGAVGTWALMKFRSWLGIKESSQLATTLDTALQNGLAYAQAQIPGVVANMPMTLTAKNEVVGLAARYALAHIPDTLKALGVDQALLRQKLEARLSINTTSAEQSIAVPNAPVVAPIGAPPVLSGPESGARMSSHWLAGLLGLILLLPLAGAAAIEAAFGDANAVRTATDAAVT